MPGSGTQLLEGFLYNLLTQVTYLLVLHNQHIKLFKGWEMNSKSCKYSSRFHLFYFFGFNVIKKKFINWQRKQKTSNGFFLINNEKVKNALNKSNKYIVV